MEPKCSMGGTIDEHNISSRLGCVWRCYKSLEHFKTEKQNKGKFFLEEPAGIDHTKEKCNWYMKGIEEIKQETSAK